MGKAKKSADAKQNKRIKSLEQLVYKTIENKQVNYSNSNLAINSSGVPDSGFLQVKVGANDGSARGDTARIGNSITLLRQQYRFNFVGLNPDDLTGDLWSIVGSSSWSRIELNPPVILILRTRI